jgi:hypothetical protein
MVTIPPEVQVRATIRAGSVYYFPEESFSSEEPHYFIVLNHRPLADRVLLLACSSSRMDAVRRRRRGLPPETLVVIGTTDYPGFTMDSIVDCNSVIAKTIDELIAKLIRGQLKSKVGMDLEIVRRLRAGVLASPMVPEELKQVLQR